MTDCPKLAGQLATISREAIDYAFTVSTLVGLGLLLAGIAAAPLAASLFRIDALTTASIGSIKALFYETHAQ